MDKQTLQRVGEWAQSRVASGEEPPWTFHKLKLLADLTAELAEGLEAGVAYAPGLGAKSGETCETFENIVDMQSYRSRSGADKGPTILPA